MAVSDEPRRSGRATKGQHKNLDGDETPKPKKAAASTPAQSSTKKSAKKSAEPEPQAEEEEEEDDDDAGEDEDVVRCLCGDTTDKGPPDFIQCDACQVWQHNICMNLPLDEKLLPDNYLCEQCSPADHVELLAQMAAGEKPWENRLRAWRNSKKRGKNRRKTTDRQSTASELKSDAASHAVSSSPAPAPAPAAAAAAAPAPAPAHTPAHTPAPVSGTKRKFEEEAEQPAPAQEEGVATPAPAPTPTPAPAPAAVAAAQPPPTAAAVPSPTADAARRASSSETKRAEKRRKSSAPAADKKADTETALVEIEELPQERKKVAEVLSKVIAGEIDARAKAQSYRIPDGHTATSLGNYHATRIEYAMYMNYGPFIHGKVTDGYSTRFRTLHANLKRNAMLIDRMLKSELTAEELSTMSTDDMASEEQLKKLAAMKEEVEKQSVMVQEDEKPRVRRTHRGDEYVDDESAQGGEQSVYTSRPVAHRQTEDATAASPTTAQLPGAAASPDRMDVDGTTQERRTSSQQFDIGSVWAKTQHSPDGEVPTQTRLLQQAPRRRSSVHRQQQEKGEKVDADVDRLLADDDNDDEYTPADISSHDATVVWRGELVQPGVTALTTTGRFVAGNDFGRFVPWEQFLPKVLEIEGRLEAKRADDYLCGLQWSKKSDVAVLALTPYDNRPAFDQIFDYFSSRSRYAVIRKGHGMSDIVKDVYITPVPAGGPLPPHIELLEHSSLDTSLPDRILIVTFVVNKPLHWDNPATAPIPFDAQIAQNGNGIPPHLRNGPAASPINTQAPAPNFSPRPEQGFTPVQNTNGNYPYGPTPNSLPPNPYSVPAPTTGAPSSQYPNLAAHSSAPPHPNPLVARILGPLANAPTVQYILSNGGEIQENILEGMKRILVADPRAADDLASFTAHLGMPAPQSGTSGA